MNLSNSCDLPIYADLLDQVLHPRLAFFLIDAVRAQVKRAGKERHQPFFVPAQQDELFDQGLSHGFGLPFFARDDHADQFIGVFVVEG